eukprot:scaffold1823_cov108-Cylindrotheca_fusiformis.AAC.3
MKIVLLPISGIITSLAGMAAVVAVAWKHGTAGYDAPASTSKDYVPIFLVSVASVCFLYALFYVQSYTAFSEFARMSKEYKEKKTDKKPSLVGIKYGSESMAMLAIDRTVGNLMEQMIPFLLSLFGYATFVSAGGAAKIGWLWIFFRSYYIFVFKKGILLFSSTMPAYCCIWFMLGRAVYVAVAKMD